MRRYLIFSITLIALIGLFVFIEDNSTTTFNILGVDITLPNALWVIIFLSIFLIFTTIYLSFTMLKNIFYKKRVEGDIKKILENIKNKILFINSFKDVKVLKEINNFTKNIAGLKIKAIETTNFEYISDLEKLENGEVVDISKYKLPKDNYWHKLYLKNKILSDENFAKEEFKKLKDEELKKLAFYIWAKSAKISEILKYDYEITKDIILAHINEDFSSLLKRTKLTPLEEIEIAKAIYQTKDPDKELEMIKDLKWGYAYLLLKYEHLDLAKEIIEQNNLKFFEYYLKLKECGERVEIDEYLQSRL